MIGENRSYIWMFKESQCGIQQPVFLIDWIGTRDVSPTRGGGGGSQQSFIRGGSALRCKPLPFYVPFLIEKVPLLHASQRKWYPFHISSWGFKIFCPFQIPKWQFSLPFPTLELVKSLPFHIPPA